MLPKFSQIVNRLYAFIYETNHSKSGLGLPSIVALVMVIDKSWTLLERHEKAFYTGLTKFVDDCKPLVNSAGNIKCPCKSCRTVLWVSIKNLPKHITRYGWDPGYKTWVHHGEPDLPPPPPVIDNTRQPQMSDMIALLNDLSYIPPNNEQNEPTQGDIGETSNEPTQAKRNEFEELYASANEELYPGCDYVTRLDFMAKFTYFKVKGKLTDSIFNEMLEFFQHVFPTTKGYKLPPSYYAIKKTFKTIGLGYESIHACVNDCFLFRGDNNKDVHFCPVCKTSRWKDSNTPGKKVPKKVLRYFPIIPRLQRLYKSSHTAKEMTWHATGKCTEPGKMQHPVDGRAWKNFDTKYPNFAKEPRNVRLGLAVDGFNPFGNLSQAYNMWPVILTTYNLPPWLCMKESSFMLTLLIPGPKSPGKDIDVYLRPLIDDLKVLWALKGVETIDVATGQKFNIRAMAVYSFTPENRKKFCQFIKGVKLPDGFVSNFKHKVTDNDTNITGLKSHDCHIMMQYLLPYGLQQYLPDEVAKPIIDLCSFFKQICSATLMEDDMLKAQSKVVNILCNLELIYPPAFFGIMIHLVIHLPLEALEGGPIHPRILMMKTSSFLDIDDGVNVCFLVKKEDCSLVVTADVARGSWLGDGGVMIVPFLPGYHRLWGLLGQPRKPNLGAGGAGRLAYPPGDLGNSVFKGITDKKVDHVTIGLSWASEIPCSLLVSMQLIGPTTLGRCSGDDVQLPLHGPSAAGAEGGGSWPRFGHESPTWKYRSLASYLSAPIQHCIYKRFTMARSADPMKALDS
ncbi:pyruvate kinase [Tanacetum coccineum]